MLSNYFYHARIRKAVATFGALFDSINVIRTNASGETISQIKVPLSYAPKRDFIERIYQTINGEEQERAVAIKLPRMSFEITTIQYDATRQLNKMNVINQATGSAGLRTKLRQPVPYTLGFQLSVYAKSQDDALQVVEQIIPTFNPKYMMAIKPFEELPMISEDVPVTLLDVSMEDSYEGPLEARRTIIYTLNFSMNVNFYGYVDSGEIIREIDVNLGTMDPNTKLVNIDIVPDPVDASPDSDFGFTTTITDLDTNDG